MFRVDVGGEGGGEPDAPVSLCIDIASACDIEIGWDFVVDFDVCHVVDLSVLEGLAGSSLAGSIGTDIGCFYLGPCIS